MDGVYAETKVFEQSSNCPNLHLRERASRRTSHNAGCGQAPVIFREGRFQPIVDGDLAALARPVGRIGENATALRLGLARIRCTQSHCRYFSPGWPCLSASSRSRRKLQALVVGGVVGLGEVLTRDVVGVVWRDRHARNQVAKAVHDMESPIKLPSAGATRPRFRSDLGAGRS